MKTIEKFEELVDFVRNHDFGNTFPIIYFPENSEWGSISFVLRDDDNQFLNEFSVSSKTFLKAFVHEWETSSNPTLEMITKNFKYSHLLLQRSLEITSKKRSVPKVSLPQIMKF